jgi:hypothetical protein
VVQQRYGHHHANGSDAHAQAHQGRRDGDHAGSSTTRR